MRFRDVIGQEKVKNRLRLSVQENRIPHAQLFTGPAGVGKLPLAVAYASYIACANRHDNDCCNTCPTCLQYSKLQHPDLHFVFPIVKTASADTCDDYVASFRELLLENPYMDLDDWYRKMDVETKQGIIYEKESGEILRKLSLKSFSDGYRVVIIWQPEKMNTSCANKLLKLLEEPPAKTIFLLVSDQPELLLPTIISRTQQVLIPRLDDEEIAQALHERYPDISAQKCSDWAHIANGNFSMALRMVQKSTQTEEFQNQFMALMRNAWLTGHSVAEKKLEALQALRQWSMEIADSKVGREKQKNFLQYVQRQVRENFVANFGLPSINYMMAEEAEFSTKFARYIHTGNVENIMNELNKAEQQIAQNGNAKIIFFDLCLQMIVMIKR